MRVPAEKNAAKDSMPEGNFYILVASLLLASAFLLSACVGIIRQRDMRVEPNYGERAGSYFVSPHRHPHQYWGAVVATGAIGTILLILDVWILVRHRRAKRQAG